MVQISSRDEFGEIAYKINAATKAFQQIISGGKGSSEVLSKSSINLASLSEENSASVQELTAQSSEIANNSQSAYLSIEDFVGGDLSGIANCSKHSCKCSRNGTANSEYKKYCRARSYPH